MVSLGLGITAFALYLIYDINSFCWQRKIPRTFFMMGTVLLAAAMLLDLHAAWKAQAFRLLPDAIPLALSAVSFAALIYSLFFALPFDKTYTQQQNGRKVYDQGVYALCRHPGILCFFAMYLMLGLAALPYPGLLLRGMLFSFLNLAYAWFQDRITFPKTFSNYPDYQKGTPFLIPTKASIHSAFRTFLHKAEEEDQP